MSYTRGTSPIYTSSSHLQRDYASMSSEENLCSSLTHLLGHSTSTPHIRVQETPVHEMSSPYRITGYASNRNPSKHGSSENSLDSRFPLLQMTGFQNLDPASPKRGDNTGIYTPRQSEATSTTQEVSKAIQCDSPNLKIRVDSSLQTEKGLEFEPREISQSYSFGKIVKQDEVVKPKHPVEHVQFSSPLPYEYTPKTRTHNKPCQGTEMSRHPAPMIEGRSQISSDHRQPVYLNHEPAVFSTFEQLPRFNIQQEVSNSNLQTRYPILSHQSVTPTMYVTPSSQMPLYSTASQTPHFNTGLQHIPHRSERFTQPQTYTSSSHTNQSFYRGNQYPQHYVSDHSVNYPDLNRTYQANPPASQYVPTGPGLNFRQTSTSYPPGSGPNFQEPLTPYPVGPVSNYRETATSHHVGPVSNYREAVAPYPMGPVPNLRETVAPYPVGPVPNFRETVAPYPVGPVPNFRETVAPYPIGPVPNFRETETPYLIGPAPYYTDNTSAFQVGPVPHFRESRTHYPLYPTVQPIQGLYGHAQQTKRRPKEPDTFDGKSTDWVDYIIQFEKVATWNGWNQHEMAQQLIMSLRGLAQKSVSELNPHQLNDYSFIKRMMGQRFNPIERETAHKFEFKNRKKYKTESVSDYGHSLRRLAAQAYPHLDLQSIESIVIDQFVEGIGNHELKRYVQLMNRPKTLDQAISFAIEYEAFEGPVDQLRKPHFSDDVTIHTYAINKNEMKDNTNKDLEEKIKRIVLQELKNDPIRSPVKQNSNEEAELDSKVKKLVNENLNDKIKSENSENKPVYRRRDIVCTYCGIKGHIKSRCFKLKNAELEKTKTGVNEGN